MNTATMKKVLMALLVLAMATMMAACDLAAPMETGNSVEVSMGGTDGARDPGGINGDSNVKWVRINVTNSSGVKVGVGDLEWKDGAWKGKISVSQSGLHTFTATAGNQDGSTGVYHVSWAGSTTLNVTGSGLSLLMPVSAGNGTRHIFYENAAYATDGWRYLEAAPSDQSEGIEWSNITDTEVGVSAQGTIIGTGQANTTAIVGQTGCTSGAAKTCDSLSLGGYDDWFLPSQDELDAMYGKKVAIGGFAAAWYWSSSEGSDNYVFAWSQFFSYSSQSNDSKDFSNPVRAVRAF
jgi:hypothetical protein